MRNKSVLSHSWGGTEPRTGPECPSGTTHKNGRCGKSRSARCNGGDPSSLEGRRRFPSASRLQIIWRPSREGPPPLHPSGFAAPPDTKISRKDTKMQYCSNPCNEKQNTSTEQKTRPHVSSWLVGLPFTAAHESCRSRFTRSQQPRLRRLTRQRTMLYFSVFSRDFRVPSPCRDPKGETMRARSAKVVASMSRPVKANLKANGGNLQDEPQAHRFSRAGDSARRRAFVYRPKGLATSIFRGLRQHQ